MILGIDGGGTTCEALVIENNTIKEVFSVAKPATKRTVFSLIKKITKKYSIEFIGLGFPAPVVKGSVKQVANIKGWKNINIKQEISKEFGIPCRVENDANCFALAQSKVENESNLVGLTLGTGLGCGIILNKEIIKGINGAAGEIGRIPYEKSTLEKYTSKQFFAKEPYEVFRLAALGKKREQQKIKEFAKHLGRMTALVIVVYDPKKVVFGGGISNSFSFFEKELKKEIKKYLFKEQYKNIIIKKSEINHAGAYGAALLHEFS